MRIIRCFMILSLIRQKNEIDVWPEDNFHTGRREDNSKENKSIVFTGIHALKKSLIIFFQYF